ncbi:MAG: phosphoserine phosphatase [Acidimicrobiia bacterium]|nr:MAG: phosphoserine phosphatase [Acidimicrobiia bacterium]
MSAMLVRVTGRDRPGITAGLMAVLAAGGAELYDVEQVAVRGRLTLGLLVAVPDGGDVLKELLYYGWENGLHVDFEVVEDASPAPPRRRFAVTVIGHRVTPSDFGAVAEAIAAGGGNIDRIVRLSRYPVVSYELAVSGGDADVIRRAVMAAAAERDVDVAVQAEGLLRRATRLVVLDMDSTLVQDEIVDLIAEEVGVGDRVKEITARAMAGELDFDEAIRERVSLLEGTPVEVLEVIARRVRLTPGARTFVRALKRMGMKVAVVSGGFTFFTERIRDQLGLDHAFGTPLEVVDGVLTGRLAGPPVDRAAKAEIVRRLAQQEGITLAQVMAVGDGANDVDMLATAGLGVAFNAKPVVREVADTAVSVPYLDALLFLLGVRREDVELADAEEEAAGEPVPVEGLPPI